MPVCAVLLRPGKGPGGGLSDVVDCILNNGDIFCDGLTWLGDGSVDAVHGHVNAAPMFTPQMT